MTLSQLQFDVTLSEETQRDVFDKFDMNVHHVEVKDSTGKKIAEFNAVNDFSEFQPLDMSFETFDGLTIFETEDMLLTVASNSLN